MIPDAEVFATETQWRLGTGPGSFEVPITANERQLALQVLEERARAEAAEAEVERLSTALDESRCMFDAAARNAVVLYRQGALDWNNKALPPDDNVLLNAGLQIMFDEPSPARDIEWHDQLSSVKAEAARLREQLAAMQTELDWYYDRPNRKVSAI